MFKMDSMYMDSMYMGWDRRQTGYRLESYKGQNIRTCMFDVNQLQLLAGVTAGSPLPAMCRCDQLEA